MSGAFEARQPADGRVGAGEARIPSGGSATSGRPSDVYRAPDRPSRAYVAVRQRSGAEVGIDAAGGHGVAGSADDAELLDEARAPAGAVPRGAADETQGAQGALDDVPTGATPESTDEAQARSDAPPAGAVPRGAADETQGAQGALDDAPTGATPESTDEAQGALDDAPTGATPESTDEAQGALDDVPTGATPESTDEAQGALDDASESTDEPDPFVEACRQRDEYLDALRRLQADFENYRKRVQRQQEESISRAGDRLVLSILPALDAFDLAAAHLVGDDQVSPGGFIQAAALLRDTLAKEGLEQVGEVGDPFDPTAHEAVEHVDDGGESGPTIDTVLRAGYRFGGRVIRPAMVKVRG